MSTTEITYQPQQIVVTEHGLAIVQSVDNESKAVRVGHVYANTPITDFKFDEIRPATPKETLEAQKQLMQNRIAQLAKTRKEEEEALLLEKHAPLKKQADDMKATIQNDIHRKFHPEQLLLSCKERELQTAIDNLVIEESKAVWHQPGTIVTLWERTAYSNKPRQKTTTTGIVQVYDGTQPTPSNMASYSLPRKGDICVFINKKDGTMSTRFDIIVRNYGGKLQWDSHKATGWLIEGETCEDNLAKRILKQIKEKAV